MRQRVAMLIFTVAACCFSFAQKSTPKKAVGHAVDRAYLQQIWDGWAKLDPANQAQYYAKGNHTFFDIAPLKYNSWDEYQAGVTKVLSGYKAATFTLNDDVEIHPEAGNIVWGTATVKSDMTTTAGKREMGAFRWTYVFGKQDGKWVVIHEHVSAPLQ